MLLTTNLAMLRSHGFFEDQYEILRERLPGWGTKRPIPLVMFFNVGGGAPGAGEGARPGGGENLRRNVEPPSASL